MDSVGIIGWDPEWAKQFSQILCARVPNAHVFAVHHPVGDEPQRYMTLYTQDACEGEVYMVREQVRNSSLTELTCEKLREGIFCNLFVINTDYGFERAKKGIESIRELPEYRDVPIVVVDGSSRREIENIKELEIPVAKVIVPYDVDALVPFLRLE